MFGCTRMNSKIGTGSGRNGESANSAPYALWVNLYPALVGLLRRFPGDDLQARRR